MNFIIAKNLTLTLLYNLQHKMKKLKSIVKFIELKVIFISFDITTIGASHDNNNEFDPIKYNDILINIGRDSTTEGQNYNTNKPLQDNINVGVV